MKRYLSSQSGFTLIELLIVIVIIGILAGVLVAIIDPVKQQNRARDASVQATLNKIGLAVGAYRSAYGAPPDGLQFLGTIEGETPVAGSGCTTGSNYCHFTLAQTPLPQNADFVGGCNATHYVGNLDDTASNQDCEFRYVVTNAGDDFAVYGKSYGINNGVFVFDSQGSEIKICDDTNYNDATCVANLP